MTMRLFFGLILLLTGFAGAVQATETSFDLDALTRLATAGNRVVLMGREEVAAASAGVQSAGAYPNPELEMLAGPMRPRGPGGVSGEARSLTLTQAIDLPARRSARVDAAAAALAAAGASQTLRVAEVVALVRLRYFELLRRQAELRAAQEDQKLMEDIRGRIALRVETGEAPRFELIKADAEMLNAQKMAQAASFRVEHARSQLRLQVGEALPVSFTVNGSLRAIPDVPGLTALRQEVMASSADLARVRAEAVRAERLLDHERATRLPSVAIKAAYDDEPDMRSSRVGVAVSLPLWDRRDGPVAEAGARLSQARYQVQEREFALVHAVESAFRQYEIALTQVTALESGIVYQAESALKVAQAAYRFGERGILEVLDAQRVYRAARNELITARYEQAAAWVEIERLRATYQP